MYELLLAGSWCHTILQYFCSCKSLEYLIGATWSGSMPTGSWSPMGGVPSSLHWFGTRMLATMRLQWVDITFPWEDSSNGKPSHGTYHHQTHFFPQDKLTKKCDPTIHIPGRMEHFLHQSCVKMCRHTFKKKKKKISPVNITAFILTIPSSLWCTIFHSLLAPSRKSFGKHVFKLPMCEELIKLVCSFWYIKKID